LVRWRFAPKTLRRAESGDRILGIRFAGGVDEDGEIEGDRDFRPIADSCATFEDAREAALQADVRGRIYIDEMVQGERGALGSPIFVGSKSDLQADLRLPVQSAVSSNTRARRAG
jgi:hypothetical protein